MEDIKKLFSENLKAVKKHDEVTSFKKPLIGRLSGVYNRLTKVLEYTEYDDATVFHEMFHALSCSAVLKRESILKFMAVIYLGQKQLSVREFEEGMTEYLTSCIVGEDAKHVRFNFPQETTIINKLAKIYGDEIILEYYLGFNNNLVDVMNNDIPNGFRDVVRLCQRASTNGEIPVPFESTKVYKKNGEEVYDNLMFDLFSKKKLVEVTSIEDFKHNVKELFSFYESDLYKICYDIVDAEERIHELGDNPDESIIRHNPHIIETTARLMGNFNNILMCQWKKLNIENDELFNNIILDEIEKFNSFASPIILDYLDYWNGQIATVYQNRKEKGKTIQSDLGEREKESNVMENFNGNANNYLGDLSSTQTTNQEFDFLGTTGGESIQQVNGNEFLGSVGGTPIHEESNPYLGSGGTPSDTSQAMEYMPIDISGLSKEQLQQLREELVPTEVKEELTQDNGYGI